MKELTLEQLNQVFIDNPQDCFQFYVKIEKAQASFLYFMLESHDGIFFYSTLDHETGAGFRNIALNFHFSMLPQAMNFLKKFNAEILCYFYTSL